MNRVYPSRINWENEDESLNTPINDVNLNKMDYALYEIDSRVVTFDTTKADESDLLQSLKQVVYNTTTGVFTFTYWNGTTQEVDLNIEKIPVSFSMDANGIITMTTSDGTQYTADVGSLIKTYTFSDSTEIDFTTTADASGNKTVTASLVAGSITGDKLQPNYLADCTSAKNDAETAAGNASNSATASAGSSQDSEAWAVGTRNGSPVPSTDPAYQNNSKYWAEHGSNSFAGLTDTDFTNLQNGQVPKYNSSTQKWENGAGGGGTSLPIDISDNVNNVTGVLNTVNGGTGNNSGYVRVGQKANTTIGNYATAEGYNTTASGNCSHAEGNGTKATGAWSHSEGGYNALMSYTTASGDYSHAEGTGTIASGTNSHSEGGSTTASSTCAHAEGSGTTASGAYSHAEGYLTIAKGSYSHVQGKSNIEDNDGTYAHIVGNGTPSVRSNAHTLDWSGNAWFAGTVTDGTGNVLSNKQDALPTVVNDRYLHTNATTGALEWAQVQGGGGSSATVLGGTLEAGDTQITFTDNAITATAMIDIYTDDESVGWIDRTVSGTTLTITFPPQSSDLAVRVRLEETGE